MAGIQYVSSPKLEIEDKLRLIISECLGKGEHEIANKLIEIIEGFDDNYIIVDKNLLEFKFEEKPWTSQIYGNHFIDVSCKAVSRGVEMRIPEENYSKELLEVVKKELADRLIDYLAGVIL